jgi:hypothetical protein
MEEAFVPGNQIPNEKPEYRVPIVTVQDQDGNQASFVPVLDPMTLVNALIETLDEVAARLTISPGLTPEPDPEAVEAARLEIQKRVEAGFLNPAATTKVDPVFQVKYEQNLNLLVNALVDMAGNFIVKQRIAEKQSQQPKSLIQVAGPGTIPPRNA